MHYIKGELLIIDERGGKVYALISVPHRNDAALGYELEITRTLSAMWRSTKKPVECFVYTDYREQSRKLFGLDTYRHILLFRELVKIKNLGCSTAMGILSRVQIEQIKKAANEGDVKFFMSFPRVGKVVAKNIIKKIKTV